MKKKKIFRYMVFSFIVFVFIFALAPVSTPAKAKENTITFKETILKAVQEIEFVMNKSYKDKADEIIKLSEKGYDYELTVDSFYNNEKPYKDYDYAKFIAAYTTIQHYLFENNLDIKNGINEINFIKMSYKDAYQDEYEIKEIDKYMEINEGEYMKDGKTYVTEPSLYNTYVLNDNGKTYHQGKPEYIDLKKVPTKYADITLEVISLEEVYAIFGLNREGFLEEETGRYEKIKKEIGNAKLNQNVMLSTRTSKINDNDNLVIENSKEIIGGNETRNTLINIATSIIGEVPYEWGGKSTKAGFDSSWYTFDESGNQKGLDCSGYIQWVLRTAGYEDWRSLASTSDFLENKLLEPIHSEELLPGDLGLFYPNNNRINHIGMYLGNGYWIHCSSEANTVVINQNEKFSIYKRLSNINELSLAQINQTNENNTNSDGSVVDLGTLSNDELMLYAKIVQCESLGEGFNGWVAVAEVIKNRVLHEKFPNTVTDVVEANRQFASLGKARRLMNKDVNKDIINVCRDVWTGDLSILNNSQIIGFKVNDGDDVWNGWERILTLGNHSFYEIN